MLTPLKAPDGQVYAAAQGSVITGGFVAGRGGNSQTVNHPTAGRVPSGAIVEKLAPSVAPRRHVKLQLHQADFTTAARIAEVDQSKVRKRHAAPAQAENSALVAVDVPAAYKAKTVEFLGELENLTRRGGPAGSDRHQRAHRHHRHGQRSENRAGRHSAWRLDRRDPDRLQRLATGAALLRARPRVTPDVTVTAKEEKARNVVLKQGASVEELVRALTAIGSTPRDIIAILQNLQSRRRARSRSGGHLNAAVNTVDLTLSAASPAPRPHGHPAKIQQRRHGF